MADDTLQPGPGVLLVAPPMLHDPNFRRTVVLLCEHGEDGSFGLILNRPLSLQLEEVLEDFAGLDDTLCLGGPVQPNTLHYLHRLGNAVPDTTSISTGISWGGDFEVLKQRLRTEADRSEFFRFFLGYAGWSPGQLDDEIEQGGWFLTRAHEALVFHEDPDRLWRTVLRSMGAEYAMLANFPDDPRMN